MSVIVVYRRRSKSAALWLQALRLAAIETPGVSFREVCRQAQLNYRQVYNALDQRSAISEEALLRLKKSAANHGLEDTIREIIPTLARD